MGGWRTGGGYGDGGGGYGYGQRGWNAPGQNGVTPELVSEATVKESVEAYIATYLPGYSVAKVEREQWHPMYIVTLKGENGIEQQMFVRGFDGQVVHVIPIIAE